MLLIELSRQVQQDGARLEYVERFRWWVSSRRRWWVVSNSWDTTVGIDFEEPRRLDLVVDFADVRVTNGHGDSSVKATLLLNLVVKLRIHTRIQDHCTEP